MSFIDGEAGKIFYEEAGEGRPVVLVHGWSANHTFWEPQITALSESYRTIAIDLRGHGRSDKPARGYSFDDHCRDLKRVMSGLGVEDATLMGWSTGGGIITKYAATVKDHIGQLCMVNPSSPRFVSNPEYVHGISIEALRAVIDADLADRPRNRRVMIEHCFHKLPSMEMLDWLWQNSMQCPSYVAVQLMEALEREDMIALLPDIQVPTTIFQGRHDAFCPPGGAEFMAERIPKASVVMFEALGHTPHLEDPMLFNAKLRRVLAP